MERISNGWNVDRVRGDVIDILAYSSDSRVLEDFEGAAQESQLSSRVVLAKTEAEALGNLQQSAWATESLLDSDGRQRIGLVFIDLQSEGAHDLLHTLRTTNVTMPIPIVMITDALNESELQYTIGHGVTGYFLSPIDPAQLRKVVRDVQDHWNLLRNAPCAN